MHMNAKLDRLLACYDATAIGGANSEPGRERAADSQNYDFKARARDAEWDKFESEYRAACKRERDEVESYRARVDVLESELVALKTLVAELKSKTDRTAV